MYILLSLSLCFWSLSMLMHIISIHHFWLCPIVWFTQFSSSVSLNIISWLFSKSLWFSLSGRLFPSSFWLTLSPPSGHYSEKIPRLPYLKYLPSFYPLKKWLFFFHIMLLISFIFHFLHLFIVWFLPEMASTPRSGTLCFLFTLVF